MIKDFNLPEYDRSFRLEVSVSDIFYGKVLDYDEILFFSRLLYETSTDKCTSDFVLEYSNSKLLLTDVFKETANSKGHFVFNKYNGSKLYVNLVNLPDILPLDYFSVQEALLEFARYPYFIYDNMLIDYFLEFNLKECHSLNKGYMLLDLVDKNLISICFRNIYLTCSVYFYDLKTTFYLYEVLGSLDRVLCKQHYY